MYCSRNCAHPNLQIQKKCPICGKKFIVRPSDIKAGNGKRCSKECYWKWRKGQLIGKKNPHWNGGRSLAGSSKFPYVVIYNPQHPRHEKRGYVLEHRLIMEEHLGRLLKIKEVVHHINGDGLDNRLENLILFPSQAEHIKYHAQLGDLFEVGKYWHSKKAKQGSLF
jgi:hypothetical protein